MQLSFISLFSAIILPALAHLPKPSAYPPPPRPKFPPGSTCPTALVCCDTLKSPYDADASNLIDLLKVGLSVEEKALGVGLTCDAILGLRKVKRKRHHFNFGVKGGSDGGIHGDTDGDSDGGIHGDTANDSDGGKHGDTANDSDGGKHGDTANDSDGGIHGDCDNDSDGGIHGDSDDDSDSDDDDDEYDEIVKRGVNVCAKVSLCCDKTYGSGILAIGCIEVSLD